MTFEEFTNGLKYLQRASGAMHARYRINSFELQFLLWLSSHCRSTGRQIVSARDFINILSGNAKRRAKYNGFMTGCIRLKVISCYEFIGRPESLAIGISELGYKVISDYWIEAQRLMKLKPDRMTTAEVRTRGMMPKVKPKQLA